MVPGDPLVTPDTAQSCASSLLHWHYAGEQPRQEKRQSASSSRETSCRPVGAAQCPHCWRPMERTRLRQPEKAHQRPWRCASSDWCRRPCPSVGSRARVCDEVAAVAHQALAVAENRLLGVLVRSSATVLSQSPRLSCGPGCAARVRRPAARYGHPAGASCRSLRLLARKVRCCLAGVAICLQHFRPDGACNALPSHTASICHRHLEGGVAAWNEADAQSSVWLQLLGRERGKPLRAAARSPEPRAQRAHAALNTARLSERCRCTVQSLHRTLCCCTWVCWQLSSRRPGRCTGS